MKVMAKNCAINQKKELSRCLTQVKKMDETSHLILHRTSRDDIRQGVTVITKGEGIHVYDQDGKRYIDLDSGVTRPVHVGYGRKELAKAAHDQMCELAYYTPCQFATVPAHEAGGKAGRRGPRRH